MAKEAKKEDKAEKKSFHLKPGEKVKLAKESESPFYDRTEAVPGIFVGKKQKYV